MSKGWTGGSTRAWRRVRALALARDNYRCRLRLDGCTTIATTVHHLVPWTGRPEDVPVDQLAGACAHCNGVTGDPGRHDPDPRPRTRW